MHKHIGLLFYMFSCDLLGCWSLVTKKFEITLSLPCHVFRNDKQSPSLLNFILKITHLLKSCFCPQQMEIGRQFSIIKIRKCLEGIFLAHISLNKEMNLKYALFVFIVIFHSVYILVTVLCLYPPPMTADSDMLYI